MKVYKQYEYTLIFFKRNTGHAQKSVHNSFFPKSWAMPPCQNIERHFAMVAPVILLTALIAVEGVASPGTCVATKCAGALARQDV